MAQQIGTNTFTVAKWVVSADATQGTHTTIQGAINSASSGDNIFIRAGTYTENLTLKVGVNITGLIGDGNEPTVTIIGKSTFTGAGSATISGLRLQTNSDFLVVVSGSNASILKIRDCYLNCTNNTGISFTNSNASSVISVIRCVMDLGTTGIALYSMSSAGTLNINYTQCTNTGGSTTQSSNSAGIVQMQYTVLASPLACSSTGIIQKQYVLCDTSAQNVTSLTTAGTGTSYARYGDNLSGTASAISIGTGSRLNLFESVVNSTNTNAITGAGTVKYGMVSCINAPGTINTTTVIPDGAVNIIGTTLNISNDANASTLSIGTGGAVKGVTLGSTTASSTTVIQAPSGGVTLTGVQGVAVSNKNYVTINTSTGQIGSDAGGGGGGGLTFSVITADQTASVNNGYICNKAGLLLLALPATAAVGSVIEVSGMNTDLGWKITQASGQTIHFGTSDTTTGATGYLASIKKYDSVRLVCNIANTDWIVLSAQGQITAN